MKLGDLVIPQHWLHGAHLGVVTSVQDPAAQSRIQVQVMGADADSRAPLWARVAVPFAGDNRGAFLIPDVGDEVLLLFIGGDPRFPVVVGALWNGQTSVPESIGGDRIDRWTLTGRNGTRIAIVEEAPGQEKVEIDTPAGVRATLTDAAGGSFRLETPTGSTIVGDTTGIRITTSGKVDVQASTVGVSAGMVNVDAGLAKFSGTVQCQALISSSVVSASYTPGAGNVW